MFKKKTYTEEFSVRYSHDAPFEIVEAYNSLVSNLISVSAEEGYKSIAVTSAVYGEGKASLAINLAYALANNLLDKKILLIDTDLRTSKISEESRFSSLGIPVFASLPFTIMLISSCRG